MINICWDRACLALTPASFKPHHSVTMMLDTPMKLKFRYPSGTSLDSGDTNVYATPVHINSELVPIRK